MQKRESKMIYLDNNASTALDPDVRSALEGASGMYGNPSSIHSEGRRARRAVEEARDEVAALVGARSEEIFFTSGGTEANVLAILGSLGGRSGRLLRTGAEHPSVREACASLAASADFGEDVVNPDSSGALDAEEVGARVGPDTRLLTVMLANNEYGGVFPVARISRIAKAAAPNVLVHSDAVQAAGRLPVDVAELGVDLLSLSAHKMHGPKGVGALFVRRGTALLPRTPGGGQERRIRAGTENTVGIVGFGVAAKLARARREQDAEAVARRRDRLESAILHGTPGARAIGAGGPRLPNTSAIAFPGVSGDALAMRLDLEGFAVSVGSACSSGSLRPSPAILSLGLSPAEARGVVRFSLSRWTTDEEVALAGERIPEVVGRMRESAGISALALSS